jgi:hypothetical protein
MIAGSPYASRLIVSFFELKVETSSLLNISALGLSLHEFNRIVKE